jgi:glutamate--cysteine ligase
MAAPATRRPPTAQLLHQVERLFADTTPAGSPLRAGVEIEVIPVTGRPPRPVPAAHSRAAIERHDPALLVDGRVSVEPGGQVELSPAPQPSTAALLAQAAALLDRLRRALAAEGMVAVSSGMNPWHDADQVGLQLDAPRYTAMQRHFDGIGRAGREMMRLTASLQVCVDRAAGEAGAEQWLLANRMGPALTAAFANSAVAGGGTTGWTSTRCLLWQRLDASRTGFDGAQCDPEAPAAAYAQFADAAEAIALPRDGIGGMPEPRQPFADWAAAGGDRPDGADVAHHLSTLFPPVRPRGYLEVRYLDAPPLEWLPVPVVVLHLLLADDRARRQALEALDPADRGAMLALWHAAAHQGIAHPWLRHEARALVDIAVAAARRAPAERVPAHATALLTRWRDEYLCTGRCWSDDQAARIDGPQAEDATAWT